MGPTYLVLLLTNTMDPIASVLYEGKDEAAARDAYEHECGRARFARCKGYVYLTTVRAEARLS